MEQGSAIRSLGALLLNVEESKYGDLITIKAAYFSFRPGYETVSGLLFFASQKGITNFLKRSIPSIWNDAMTRPPSTDMQKATYQRTKESDVLQS